MAYKIKVSYETGDSFHSEDVERTLEMEWQTLNGAQAALNRIQEHWTWYNATHKDRWGEAEKVERPKWHAEGKLYEGSLKIDMDNGTPVLFLAPWCGYFERLYGASIIQDLPSFSV